ncbi:MAG: hypothetical protein IIU35_04775 [Neisseriaceae bacterium]|nr:hypothetical protein [Neisseriaceae bacterium]
MSNEKLAMGNEQLFRFALRQNSLCLDNTSTIIFRQPERNIEALSKYNCFAVRQNETTTHC